MTTDPITYDHDGDYVFGEVAVDMGWGTLRHSIGGKDATHADIAAAADDWAAHARKAWPTKVLWETRFRGGEA